jgi:hypothetical protein
VQGVLGIFQKLVASKAHDQEGFRILVGLITHMPPETLQPYMPTVCFAVQTFWDASPACLQVLSRIFPLLSLVGIHAFNSLA